MREALAVTHGTGTQLVVNDYWQAAIEVGAKHVHLGQEDLAHRRREGNLPRQHHARPLDP